MAQVASNKLLQNFCYRCCGSVVSTYFISQEVKNNSLRPQLCRSNINIRGKQGWMPLKGALIIKKYSWRPIQGSCCCLIEQMRTLSWGVVFLPKGLELVTRPACLQSLRWRLPQLHPTHSGRGPSKCSGLLPHGQSGKETNFGWVSNPVRTGLCRGGVLGVRLATGKLIVQCTLRLLKIFGIIIFKLHSWVWPKSWMYTKFWVPRSTFVFTTYPGAQRRPPRLF